MLRRLYGGGVPWPNIVLVASSAWLLACGALLTCGGGNSIVDTMRVAGPEGPDGADSAELADGWLAGL